MALKHLDSGLQIIVLTYLYYFFILYLIECFIRNFSIATLAYINAAKPTSSTFQHWSYPAMEKFLENSHMLIVIRKSNQ